MVDIDTRRVVDLLASRKVEDVAEWLKSYPNIRTVSRDGSVSYKSAIEQAGTGRGQVSDHMLDKGKTFRQISAAIREKEYDGSDSTIRMFATRERKIMKETAGQGKEGEKIERKWLINLLYRPIEDVSSISAELLDRIIGEYPVIGNVYDAVSGFKQTLFGKKESELDKWLEETEAIGNR